MYEVEVTPGEPPKPPRVLDFDIETRKIGFHDAGRFAPAGCEPVAVAFKWHGEKTVNVRTMNQVWTLQALKWLVRPLFEAFAEADVITGHYIKKFDLPILAGVALETGVYFERPLTVLDTKSDLVEFQGMSKSQENLAALMGIEESKFHVNDNTWRQVARLTKDGMAMAQERVVGDVQQHEAIYNRLLAEGQLGRPNAWV